MKHAMSIPVFDKTIWATFWRSFVDGYYFIRLRWWLFDLPAIQCGGSTDTIEKHDGCDEKNGKGVLPRLTGEILEKDAGEDEKENAVIKGGGGKAPVSDFDSAAP